LPGRTIGKGSTVGAGSIVTKVCRIPFSATAQWLFSSFHPKHEC
jgi:acetyltransferase-like isoleucine patch superfamily enzyme